MDFRNPPGRVTRFALHYVFGVIALHIGLLVYGIYVHGPGWDEVGHLPAGLSHWHTGRFDLYHVNPPLVRMVATAPLVFRDVGVTWKWNPVYEYTRPEWDLGKELIETHGREYFALLRPARLACLPFSLLAIWIVWRWSRDLFGPLGGMLSVTVWALSPLVLTNAQMITPDVAAAALGAWACYFFRLWLAERTTRFAFLSGVILGLTELTKFTWLILFAVWPLQWLLHRRILPSQHSLRSDAAQLVILFSLSVLVINAGYGFEGSFTPLGEFEFLSRSLGGRRIPNENTWIAGNRFKGTVLSAIPVPLPANMVRGIDRQKLDFESEFPSYLRGEWRRRGWWYYYLYGLIVKEPVAFLLLSLLALTCVARLGYSPGGAAEALNLMLPGLALFVFVSSQTGFNHHLRYVLPSLIPVATGVGVCCAMSRLRPRTAVAAWILVAAGSGASLWAFPHMHSYFNLLAGGTRNGPQHLLNSNIDWGQDILLLEAWANENPDKPLQGVVHSLPVSLGVRELTSLPREEVPRLLPHALSAGDAVGPLPGRYAVNVGSLYEESGYEYFRSLRPIAVLGGTVFIFEVSLVDANRIRQQARLPLLPN